MPETVLTYSHSLMIPLTRACGAHCAYCTFKTSDTHLLTFDEIESLLRTHVNTGISEVLLSSGQALGSVPEVERQWTDQGYASFAHYVRDIEHLILENQLLPSLDIGPMTYAELELIAPYTVSVSLLLENVNNAFMKTLQKNKSIDAKIETLSDAGLLQIPVSTGILIGLGESVSDLRATLDVIAELHGKYRHVQTVVFQYAHITNTAFAPSFRYEDLRDLLAYAASILPEVPVSVPVNAPPFWTEAVPLGIRDIGRVFEGLNGIEWDKPAPKLTEIEKTLSKKNIVLKPRFPVTAGNFKKFQFTGPLLETLDEWMNKNEYAYYRRVR